jgi:Galactose oxidase, central domain
MDSPRTGLAARPRARSACAPAFVVFLVVTATLPVAMGLGTAASTIASGLIGESLLAEACQSLQAQVTFEVNSAQCSATSASAPESGIVSITSDSSGSPAPRAWASMTFDIRTDSVILFGGLGASGLLDDTWSFSDGVWTELFPTVSPPARFGAVMVYDSNPTDGYLLLFGGKGAGGYLDDTWKFTGTTWKNLTPSVLTPTNTPSPRANATIAFDDNWTTNEVLLFGGQGVDGALNDTWQYLDGSWSLARIPNQMAPPPRASAGLVFDDAASDKYLVLFGGTNGTEVLGDTWELRNGTGWIELANASPPSMAPRFGEGIAYDAANSYVLLFGGVGASGPLDDSWWFGAGQWHAVLPARMPSPRLGPAMAYDRVARDVILLGGASDTNSTAALLGDTWIFSGDTWSNVSGEVASSANVVNQDLVGPVLAVGLLVGVAVGVVAWVRVDRSRSGLSARDRNSDPTLSDAPPSAAVDDEGEHPGSGDFTSMPDR